jgi:hypothetical protein
MTAHATIQSSRTADFQADSKPAVFVGIFADIVSALPLFRSPVTLAVSQADFSPPSLHPKIRFPRGRVSTANTVRQLGNLEGWEAKSYVSNPVSNYCGFNPRASNCRLHSAGASRNRSTPMPRGSRPRPPLSRGPARGTLAADCSLQCSDLDASSPGDQTIELQALVQRESRSHHFDPRTPPESAWRTH